MNPFLILLMGLGVTVGAEAQGDWRRRDRMDRLRRQLGLWEQAPTYFKGSIANRLDWIESQFGLRAAIWAREATVMTVEPLGFFKGYDESGMAPFLPWLAWRLVNGDKPELVAVLEAEGHQVEKGTAYTKDNAWSDLRRLLDWFGGAKPNIFNYTWDQAIAAEKQWFPSTIKKWKNPYSDWNLPAGDLIYRFALREDDTDEDDKQGTGEWIVTEMPDLDACVDAVAYFQKRFPMANDLVSMTVYVLQDPTGEPQAAIIAYARNDSMVQILGDHVEQWAHDGGDEEQFSRLVEFMLHQWPNASNWYYPSWVFIAESDTAKQLDLIDEYPEILGGDDGSQLDSRGGEWFSWEFMQKWANSINAKPTAFEDLYTETASHQDPSEAFLIWLETGKRDLRKNEETGKNAKERIPGVLHKYTYDNDENSRADLTEMHEGSHEYDDVFPWELKIWDLYTHPSGAVLEVKAQIYIIYKPHSTWAWVVSIQAAMEFREDPMDQTTWIKSDNYDDFDFHSIVESSSWGRRKTGRALSSRAIEEVFDYNGPFEELETTNSLDYALQAAWTAFTELFEHIDIDDEDRIKRYFVQQDLLDPRPEIEVGDILETIELLN